MSVVLLGCLAVIDGIFAGFRDAAGRDPRVLKWQTGFYTRALVRGLAAGAAATLVTGVCLVMLLAVHDAPRELWTDMLRASRGQLLVVVPYALIVILAFIPYLIPSIDVRCLTSVSVFGPFTLIRPLIVVASAVSATLHAAHLQTVIVTVVGAIMVLAVGPGLGLAWRYAWHRDARHAAWSRACPPRRRRHRH